MPSLSTPQNHPVEFTFTAQKPVEDPFNQVELNALLIEPGGRQRRVPGFWAGGQTWKVRLSGHEVGEYRFQTLASVADEGLHHQEGKFQVTEYKGENPLYRHGPVRVSANKRYLEHVDGSPFLWLGDTWWMGLTKRLPWPGDFQWLARHRREQGFTLIQIVAGFCPDMDAFDPRGEGDGGFAWEKDFARVNPAFFDAVEGRVRCLIDEGLLPCWVACWGYYLLRMGMAQVKKHWRYMIARWGALPGVWCLAGEGEMPWYNSTTFEQDRQLQRHGWADVASYVKSIDGYEHPVTIHPTTSSKVQIVDPSLLDLDMLQTGHDGWPNLPNTARRVIESRANDPRMPTVVSEVCYEGIMESSRDDAQRYAYWSSMLSGAGGFTYGANGIWQFNRANDPYGASPHGMTWGGLPWREAAMLPGAKQLGLAKKLLGRYPWQKFSPRTDWFSPVYTPTEPYLAFAAGVPGEVRMLYMSGTGFWRQPWLAKHLELDVKYRAFFFDPCTGEEIAIGLVETASDQWAVPAKPPRIHDWVLVLEKAK
ncbi:MAG: DUF4038 domain-containing protein [Phycisphaeraceae bacterium]|nr:DUF4038 domain-containing protein [Phycisphaeraceae bacterium]